MALAEGNDVKMTAEAGLSDLLALPAIDDEARLSGLPRLRLNAAGEIRPLDGAKPLMLSFAWRNRQVTATIEPGEQPVLRFECRLASLPFTIEDPLRRQALLRAVERVRTNEAGELCLTNGNRVVLRDVTRLTDDRTSIADVVARIALIALQIAPVADRLESEANF